VNLSHPIVRTRSVLAGSLGLAVVAATFVAAPVSSASGVQDVVTLAPGRSHTVPVESDDLNLRVAASFTIPALPQGGPLYVGVPLRAQDVQERYHAVVRVDPDGSMRLDIRQVDGAETTLSAVPLPEAVKAGQTLRVEGHVAGTAPVSLAARAWVEGASRPGWMVDHDDSRGDLITQPGTVGATAYLSGSAEELSLTVSDVEVVTTDSQPAVGSDPAPAPTPTRTAAPNPTPTPTRTATPTPTPTPTRTATPTPTPTLTPIAISAPGTVKPDASNTGVPAGTALKIHYGDMRIRTAGTVVDAMDIRGFLRVEAPNVTVKRSVIRGGTATRVDGVVTVTPTATNFLIQDSDVYPSKPSVMLDGIKGGNFTARRVEVRGGVDNIKVHGSNVLIESSYLHSPNFFSSDPLQGGGATHNDGIQVQGGNNIRIIGNTVTVPKTLNAAIQVTQDWAATSAKIERNWLDGGGCTVNLNHKKRTEMRTVALTGNRFGRSTEYVNCGIIMTNRVYPSLSGNTYTDGAAVKVKYM